MGHFHTNLKKNMILGLEGWVVNSSGPCKGVTVGPCRHHNECL